MWSKFFGSGNSKNKISSQDRAILDLKTQRDNLKKYQKKISHITARETEIARECLRNNDKSRALLALRRKKYQESLLSKTDQQLAQLEGLVADVEFALIQKDVVFGLQQGSKVMKEIQREMGGLERVELLVREGEEARAYQEEVSDILAGKMSNQDEEEVEDELAALGEQMGIRMGGGDESLPSAPKITAGEMPDAPDNVPANKVQEQEERQAVAA